MHHKVGAFRHFRPSPTQGLHVAVAQRCTQGAGTNERRVADDEICLRPFRLTRLAVLPLRHQRRFVRDQRAGDGVGFKGAAVPAAQQLAVVVMGQRQFVPVQHGVAAFNVAVVVHHGFGHGLVAACADVPLQIANPQHQLGHGGGAFVELNAQQLLGCHGFAFQAQQGLGFAQRFKLVHDFAFQAFQVFERDVQKISASASRIQHAGVAKLVVKFTDFGAGFFLFDVGGFTREFGGFVRQHQRGGLGHQPVGAQRLDHGGQHQPLDVGARGVVRA